MAKKQSNVVGGWAFLVGVVLAVILGLTTESITQALAIVLVLIGIVIGLLNIADEETTPFLMAGAVLIIASSLGSEVVGVVAAFSRVLDALLVLFVPAIIVVSLRHVLKISKN